MLSHLEKFLANEQRYLGGEVGRFNRLQVRDPMDEVNVPCVQLQELEERIEIFVWHLLDYYRQKGAR